MISLSIWNKDFILLLTINTVWSMGAHILTPILPIYASEIATAESQLGYLVAAYALASLCFRPFSGHIADRFDRKKVLFISQVSCALLLGSISFMTNIYVLIGSRALHGMLNGTSTTIMMVSAVRTLPKERMGQGLGVFGVSVIGSQAIAPAFGLYILESFGYYALFGTVTGFLLAAAFMTLLLRPQPKEEDAATAKFSFRNIFAKEVAWNAVVASTFMMGSVAINNFLVIFATGRGIGEVGFYFTIQVCILIVIRLFTSRIIDKFPYQYILYPCVALCIGGLLFISFAQSFAFIAIAGVLLGFGYGFANPTAQTAVMRQAPAERYGAASATYYLGIDVALMFSSVMMGYVAEYFSYATGFQVLCVPMALAVPIMFVLTHGKKQKVNPA